MIGDIFERAIYHFEERIDLIREHQIGICNTSILLNHEQMCPHHGYKPIQGRSMREINNHGYQNTTQIHVIEDSNLGHSYQKYTIDLCQMNTNSSTSMIIQPWIHAGTSYNILPSQPREKDMSAFNRYPGSSSYLPQSMILSM